MAETPKMKPDQTRAAIQAMGRIATESAELQDQLRELLSYCESQTVDPDGFKQTDAEQAYWDVATRLRNILDGE